MACSLPYIAADQILPATLPTVHEIESAEEILSDTTGCRVVGVGTHFVVKYGVQVDPLEGETMLFLAQTTLIPTPRLYSLFQNSAQDTTYIVMERITGTSLDQEWPRMDTASKEAVAFQLRNIFRELRKLASPGGYCSVGHRGLPDGLFWTADPSNPFAGPFDTEAELNEAMISKYTESGLSKYKANYYSRAFKDIFRSHEPTFSHGAIQRKNILVRNTATTGNEETRLESGHLEVVIIDWEYAGWYPSYWEYARAIFAGGRWDDDWNDWVDEILEPFRNEYAWMETLIRELWS